MSNKNYSAQVQNAVDDYNRKYSSSQLAIGYSLALFENSSLQFAHSQGYGISADTPFPLASVSKPILSSLISDLQVDLQMDVRQFYPNLKSAKPIRILDCLNQTSGIPEYLYIPTEECLNQWSLKEYCDFIQTLPIDDKATFEYSNSNFILLTGMIEIIFKQSYSSLPFSI